MKKIMYAAMIVLGTISFSACENKSNSSDTEADGTVVESDTTNRSETIEADSTSN